jgi:hypothetical protein
LKESAVNGIVLIRLICLTLLLFLESGFPGRPMLPVFGHLGDGTLGLKIPTSLPRAFLQACQATALNRSNRSASRSQMRQRGEALRSIVEAMRNGSGSLPPLASWRRRQPDELAAPLNAGPVVEFIVGAQ